MFNKGFTLQYSGCSSRREEEEEEMQSLLMCPVSALMFSFGRRSTKSRTGRVVAYSLTVLS